MLQFGNKNLVRSHINRDMSSFLFLHHNYSGELGRNWHSPGLLGPLDSSLSISSRRMPIRRLSTHGTGINIARRCRPRGNPRCIRSLLFSLATATRDTAKRSTNVLWAPRRHCVRLWLARSSVEWLWLAPRRHMSGRSRIGINDDKRLRKHLPGLVGYCRGFYSSLP